MQTQKRARSDTSSAFGPRECSPAIGTVGTGLFVLIPLDSLDARSSRAVLRTAVVVDVSRGWGGRPSGLSTAQSSGVQDEYAAAIL